MVGSIEWFQDAMNADQIIVQALAEAMAAKIDLAALYGGVTAGAGVINLPGPHNPRGILATLLATRPGNVLGDAANGTLQTALTYWGEVLDTLFTVADGNEKATALIQNSKLERQYAKATDTTGQPLNAPEAVQGVERFTTNQIPIYTKGTMASRATQLSSGSAST